MKKQISLIISLALLFVICLFTFSVNADELEIKELNNSNTTVSTYYKEYQFSGITICPAVTVKYNGKVLAKGTDYTVEYSNNLNIGNAVATVTGIGEYSGTVEKIYPIVPVAVTDELKITQQYNSVAYDGKAKTPTVTIKYRRDTLVKGKDFTISYSANTSIGTAKINIKGIGNYSFKKTLTFRIVPGAVSGLKFYPDDSNTITLKWNKMNNISGYQIVIYDYDKKAYKSVKYVSAGTTSYSIKGLSPSTLYKYNIRAYRDIGNDTYYGVYTKDLLTRTKSASTTLTSVYMNNNGLNAKWKTVRGVGYVLIYATKKDFSNAKEVYINDSRTSSYVIKNVNKKVDYYVQICPYTSVNNVNYFSKRSAVAYTGFGKRLSYYETTLVYNPDRTVNVKLACSAINGTVVYPGETFSFNQVVGQRTTAKGYKNAPVIVGNTVTDGIGGGVCQVASTLFNASLYANVQIVDRAQHSMRNTYVPYGRDATVYWGSQDYKWKNNTKYPIKVYMRVQNNKVICEFYTSGFATVPSVKLDVQYSCPNGYDTYVLRRYVNGVCNYTTKTSFNY